MLTCLLLAYFVAGCTPGSSCRAAVRPRRYAAACRECLVLGLWHIAGTSATAGQPPWVTRTYDGAGLAGTLTQPARWTPVLRRGDGGWVDLVAGSEPGGPRRHRRRDGAG